MSDTKLDIVNFWKAGAERVGCKSSHFINEQITEQQQQKFYAQTNKAEPPLFISFDPSCRMGSSRLIRGVELVPILVSSRILNLLP